MDEATPKLSAGSVVLGVVGIVLYLGVGWVYLASGLVVPFPWVIGMWAVWVAGLPLLRRMFTTRPVWAWTVAAGAAVAWVLIVMAGGALFGWTA